MTTPPSIFKVYLLSKATVSVELSKRMPVADVCRQIKRRIGLENDADYALFDWSADSRLHIPDQAILYEWLSRWPPDALTPSGGRIRKLVFRRRLYLPNSALELEEESCYKDTDPSAAALTLAYDEAFHHVMTGCYPCDFDRALRLAALAIHRDNGDTATEKGKGFVRSLFGAYIPEYLLAQCSPAMLERIETSLMTELTTLRGCSRVDDQKLYIQYVKMHNPWYGSAFFHSQSKLYDDTMRYVRVGIGYSGLYLFVVKDDKLTVELYHYSEIQRWTVRSDGTEFVFWVDDSHAIVLFTNSADEMDSVVQEYVVQNVLENKLRELPDYKGVRRRNRSVRNYGDELLSEGDVAACLALFPKKAPPMSPTLTASSGGVGGGGVGSGGIPPSVLTKGNSVDSAYSDEGRLVHNMESTGVHSSRSSRRNSTEAIPWGLPLPEGWRAYKHVSSDRIFYYNKYRGISQWDPPSLVTSPIPSQATSTHSSPIPIPSPPHDADDGGFGDSGDGVGVGVVVSTTGGGVVDALVTPKSRERVLSEETLDDIVASIGTSDRMSSAFGPPGRAGSSFTADDFSLSSDKSKRPQQQQAQAQAHTGKPGRTLWQNIKVSGRPDKVYSSFRHSDKSAGVPNLPKSTSPPKQRQIPTVTSDATKKLQRAFRVLSPHSESEESGGAGEPLTEEDFVVVGGGNINMLNVYKGVHHQPSAASVELAEVSESTFSEDMLNLPVGWGSRIDEASGRRYYYNITTGQSTWDKPVNHSVVMQQQRGGDGGIQSSNSGGTFVNPTLDLLKSQVHASQSGALITVTFNSSGSSSTHSSPMASPLNVTHPTVSELDGGPAPTQQRRTSLAQQQRPLPDGWRQLFDPASGRYYYYSASDGVSTWDFPNHPDTGDGAGLLSGVTVVGRTRVSSTSDVYVAYTPPVSGPSSPQVHGLSLQQQQQQQQQQQAKLGGSKVLGTGASVTIPTAAIPKVKLGKGLSSRGLGLSGSSEETIGGGMVMLPPLSSPTTSTTTATTSTSTVLMGGRSILLSQPGSHVTSTTTSSKHGSSSGSGSGGSGHVEVKGIGLFDWESRIPTRRPTITEPSIATAQEWYYRDESNVVQGPYPRATLKLWVDAGYFNVDTMIAPAGADHPTLTFQKLGDVFRNMSDAFSVLK